MNYQLNERHREVLDFIPAAAKRSGVTLDSQDGFNLVFRDKVSNRTILKLIRYAYAEKAEKETGVRHLTRDDVHKNISGAIMATELFAFDKEALSYGAVVNYG